MTTELPDQLEVYKFPSTELKRVAKKFDFEVDGKEHDVLLLSHRLYGAMKKHSGLSIAATQCGVDFRIFVVDSGLLQTYDRDVLRPEIYINPVIIDRSQETVRFKEGCLSYPKCTAMVKRNKSITISYQDEFGVTQTQAGGGLFSIMVQHEIDHLDGKSLIDVVDAIERDKLYKQINKARK